jgi:predicted NBD/HSP70 family sugar kinase
MWLAIDIGGTKTLLCVFTQDGKVEEEFKFPTNHDYKLFLTDLKNAIQGLKHKDLRLACVASPGKIDRDKGVGLAYGNLPWIDVPLGSNIEQLVDCPVLVENDAKLAGLSEARELKHRFHKVLYITISTGIGAGLITNGIIDPFLADAEVGLMPLEHNGKIQRWQEFASGRAIVNRFNKLASEITDPAVWKIISHDIAIGLIDVLAAYQPDIVVVGGGVGSHFDKFGAYLQKDLKEFESPMVEIPPIVEAKHPEEAVIYGCYELMKDHGRSVK